MNPGTEPSIEVLLSGSMFGSLQGSFAFCGIYLVSSTDAGGTRRHAIIDTGHVGLRPQLDAALAARGLSRTDIDLVLLTHAHWDHIQNIDMFPHAEIALAAAELDYIVRPHALDFATPAWTNALLREQRVTALHPDSVPLAGVTALDAAGHSAGSLAYAVECAREVCVVSGDALPCAQVAVEGSGLLVFHDQVKADAAVVRLVDTADVLYPGHDRPFRIRDGNVEFLMPMDFTLTGATPSTIGLKFLRPGALQTTVLLAPTPDQQAARPRRG